MRILGIDPGLRLTGYGCIDVPDGALGAGGAGRGGPGVPGGQGGARGGRGGGATIVEAGVFRLNAKASVSERLAELDDDFRALLERVRPERVGVEMLFAHYKHPTTAIVMGHARGVLLLAIRRAGLPLLELRPTMVKKSLTGHGHAKKDQMQRAIQSEFGLGAPPEPADIADALAIALCASRRDAAGTARRRATLPAALRVMKG